MNYYLIIRGPLGSGKSTISEKLAQKLGAKLFSVDRVLDEYNLTDDKEDGYVSQKSFLRANEIIVQEAAEILKTNIPIIFDGNFYWQSQIDDLIKKLNYPHCVFTLKVPLDICIDRDDKREKRHGKDAAEVVFNKSIQVDCGIPIDGAKDLDQIIKEIILYLPKN
jgi:tRNA uridine 5-carbamoylmethylation protein Kti12